MPRLLIAGCGYLGQAVADLFLDATWEVEGWTMSQQSTEQLAAKSYPVRAVDISKSSQVQGHVGNFDAVVHAASTRGGDANSYRRVYLDGVGNLFECFRDSKVLFVSSTSVYGQTGGEWVTEESVADPKPETGKILREAEELTLSKKGTVVRLGGIYGPGRSAVLKKFLSGDALIDPENDRFVNEIHRDDAATAVQALLAHARSAAQIYNVVDNEPILLSDCYRWLSAKLNRPLPAVGRSTSKRKRGDSNKRVGNAKLRALGWGPRYPDFVSGMEKSVLPGLASEIS